MPKYYLAQQLKTFLENRDVRLTPPLTGKMLLQIPDPAPGSENALYILECTKEQHDLNKALMNIEELTKKKAAEIAATYRPAKTYRRKGFLLEGKTQVNVPGFNLDDFLKQLTAGSVH